MSQTERNLTIDMKCPITMTWLEDPVTVPCCGKAFSRDALVQWQQGSSQCPCCQGNLRGFNAQTAPRNTTLASIVETAQQINPADALRSAAVHRHQWSAEFRPIKTGHNIGKLCLSLADSNFKMRKSLLVLMVDNSGSMGYGSGGSTPASQVRAALAHIHGMSRLNKHVQIALIEYQSSARLMPFTPQSISEFVGRGGTHFRSSFQVLGELLRGYTCSDLEKDKDKANNIGSVSVAFMTDGQDGGNQATLVRDFKTVLEDCWIGKGYDIVVHTIGFGSNCNKTLLEGMRTAGNMEGVFRYAEPTDGDDTLCQKITDIYDISSKGTSKPVRICIPGPAGSSASAPSSSSASAYNVRISTNEFGNGQAELWVTTKPERIQITTEVDTDCTVTVDTNNSDIIIKRTLNEWCSYLIDQIASSIVTFPQAPPDGLVKLFCGLMQQRINELRPYVDENDITRLDFMSEQLQSLKAGTALNIGRLSDMRFTSMFISHGDKSHATRKAKDTSTWYNPTQINTVQSIQNIQSREEDLKHYSRLNKGKKRNAFQELICSQPYDTVQDIDPQMLDIKSLSHNDKDGNTALMLAAHAGHSKLVKIILESEPYQSGKLDVNQENPDHESALTMSIKKRGFQSCIKVLASHGALLPKDRKKGLERYAIEHKWTRAAEAVSSMPEMGSIGTAGTSNFSMNDTMTPEYMRYLYAQAKRSPRFDEFKDSYLPLFLSKGPTELKDLVIELMDAGVKPTIEHLTEYGYPKKADVTTPPELYQQYLDLVKLMVQYNPMLLTERNSNGETGLYTAVKRGCKPHLLWFLEQGCDIEAANNMGATPLWSACYRGRRSFIEILLDKGANIAHQNEQGNIPLYGACERGPREIAELLISRGSPIEHYNNNGDSLILVCCRNGQAEVLQCLLEYASEEYVYHASAIDDFNAVMSSAEAGYGECITILSQYGFDLNLRTPTTNIKVLGGATALHIAAYYGKTEAINALLACGADPNARDVNGSTPLHLAVIQGYVPAILLLRNVTDLSAKDNENNTAMAYCRDRSEIRAQLVDPALDSLMDLARHPSLAYRVQAFDLLKSHSGVFNESRQRFLSVRDHIGRYPLLEATLYGDYSFVSLLVDLGVGVDMADIYGMYPLTWAKHNRNQRLVKLLESHSSDQTKQTVGKQLERLERLQRLNSTILFLGKPAGEVAVGVGAGVGGGDNSGIRERMALTPTEPKAPALSQAQDVNDLLSICPSNDAVVKYFKDDRFQQLQNSRLLWNAKAFTVSVCANSDHLVPDRVMAIAMYTNNSIVAQIINAASASSGQSDTLEKQYTAVLLQGLRALPPFEGEVFIGLESVNRDKYRVGTEFVWDRLVSASTLWRVAMEGTPSFTTKSRKGVIFAVRSKTGRLVSTCSQYAFDSELVFLPNTKFRVYDWFHGDPVALAQPNIRAHSYHVEDTSASWLTTEQICASDKALIIALDEVV